MDPKLLHSVIVWVAPLSHVKIFLLSSQASEIWSFEASNDRDTARPSLLTVACKNHQITIHWTLHLNVERLSTKSRIRKLHADHSYRDVSTLRAFLDKICAIFFMPAILHHLTGYSRFAYISDHGIITRFYYASASRRLMIQYRTFANDSCGPLF